MKKTFFILFMLFISSVLFFNSYAFAQFDWNPEYRSMTELDPTQFELPSNVNATYQSNAMTYVFLPEWQHRWLLSKNSFTMAFGSLGSRQFLMDRHLRLKESVRDWLELRVNYFDQKNFEDQQMHFYLEPVIWFKSWLGVSAYFEPEFQKRNDNIGYALLVKPDEQSELKLFYTDILFTRNSRNNISDRFLNSPTAYGAVYRTVNTEQFLEAAVRFELPVRWNYPDTTNLYQYYRSMIQVMGSRKITQDVRLNVRLLADRLSESATSTPAAESWLKDRIMGTLSTSLYNVGPFSRWTIIPGLHFAYRGWASNTGNATLSQAIPQIWIEMPAFGEGDNEDRISLGWDIDVFTTWTTGPILAETRGTGWEHRLNTKYEIKLINKLSAVAMATFNINNITSGSLHIFQGGAAQVQYLF
ncbi:MAG: hypothetical protein KA715_10600 [Xanthomonadaceae bacterium]|nr:hypothetical protein [Xanthomonadaceae bacterium]